MATSEVKFRAGADPEVFMHNGQQFVSVIGKVPGTKWNPLQVQGLPQGFTLQQDNVSLEFGIPPAASKEEFRQYINEVKYAGLKFLKGLSYHAASCAVFPADQMQDAEAHIFGCEPDYNAWTRHKNRKPAPPHPFMRSAGGHVHVETKLPPTSVVKAMDLFLGVPSLFYDKDGAERRQLYGKAGAYRKKPYGVEYRTLSNFWIFDDNLIDWVWNQTDAALTFVRTHGDLRDTRIRTCIDESNLNLAQQLLSEYEIAL